MSGAWVSFVVIISVQIVFFALTAFYFKKPPSSKLLLRGAAIGMTVGLVYDILLGGYFGLFSYTLGFEIQFLLINASLSYGIFAANTLLLEKVSTIHFVIWLSALVSVYEITNFYFPVWSYNFALPLIPFFILCLIGYSSGALLTSFIAKLLFKQPFVLEIRS